MMTRREFVQGPIVAGGLAFATARSAHAQGRARFVDQLTDSSGKYAVAPLPYGYDALEPAIDARTVELHYNNHHKPAVTAANRAEEELAKAREGGQFALVKHYEKELAYQLSSHILHSIYWTNLGGKGGEPSGELGKAINAQFGDYGKFKAQLAAVSGAVEASGWGLLGYHPSAKKLMILQVENHQKQTAWESCRYFSWTSSSMPITSSTRTGGPNTSITSSASSTGTTSPSGTIRHALRD